MPWRPPWAEDDSCSRRRQFHSWLCVATVLLAFALLSGWHESDGVFFARSSVSPLRVGPAHGPSRELTEDWGDLSFFEHRAAHGRTPNGTATPVRRLDAGQPYHWLALTGQAAFSPRYAHAALIDGHERLFVIGGATADGLGGGHSYLNDIWRSEDGGRGWHRISNAKFPDRFRPRRGHAATMDQQGVVMFVAGGFCGKDCEERYLNDWWSSNGGDVWHDMRGIAPARWSPRHGHSAVTTRDDHLIVLGGHDGQNYLNDVWTFKDPSQAHVWGGDWHQAADHAPWTPRYGHAVVVSSSDDLYLLGGFFAKKQTGNVQCLNDVWVSSDRGRSWQLVVRHADWTGRYQHGAAMNSQDEIVVVGGIDVDLQRYHDTWRSKDGGRTWSRMNDSPGWSPRYEHALVVDKNDSLYLIGGMSSDDHRFSDVWRSERTCTDNVECHGEGMICRDGTKDNFVGLPNPICVSVCDRRYFDDCSEKEACRVEHQKPVCVDPCDFKECKEGNVCEVTPRGGYSPADKDEPLNTATAYCLSCQESQTKFACDKLKQCTWSAGEEACLTRCKAVPTKKGCQDEKKRSGDRRCSWNDGECVDIDDS